MKDSPVTPENLDAHERLNAFGPGPQLSDPPTQEEIVARACWLTETGWMLNDFYSKALLQVYRNSEESRAYGRLLIEDGNLELDGLTGINREAYSILQACDSESSETELQMAIAGAIDVLESRPELFGTEVLRDGRLKWPDEYALPVSSEEFEKVWQKMRTPDGDTRLAELTREEQLIYTLGKVFCVAQSAREALERRGEIIAQQQQQLTELRATNQRLVEETHNWSAAVKKLEQERDAA